MKTSLQVTEARLRFATKVIRRLQQENADLAQQLAQVGSRRRRIKGLCTFAEAEERARKIHELRAKGWVHARIAAELGVSRDLVTYYLSAKSKARIRAGL